MMNHLPEEIEGRSATIHVRMKDDMPPLEYSAVVSFVSPEMEAADLYRVWAEVDMSQTRVDQTPLRPGMEAEMLIHVD